MIFIGVEDPSLGRGSKLIIHLPCLKNFYKIGEWGWIFHKVLLSSWNWDLLQWEYNKVPFLGLKDNSSVRWERGGRNLQRKNLWKALSFFMHVWKKWKHARKQHESVVSICSSCTSLHCCKVKSSLHSSFCLSLFLQPFHSIHLYNGFVWFPFSFSSS